MSNIPGIASKGFRSGRIRLALIFFFVLLLLPNPAHSAVKIGVLAKNGAAKALKQWSATADFLNEQLPGEGFEIVPLEFNKVFPAIEAAEVDFFLINSSMFVTAQRKYGASPILTMINSRQGKELNSFGGVILASAYNDAINSLEDLKGKRFMAVAKASFGGWQMAYKELIDAGINPEQDFAALEFGGKHDNVLFAIQNETVDAGTVRTDTLERLVASGALFVEDFKIINKQDLPNFPFVCSTKLYPEWPLAKVASTSDELAERVAAALKTLDAEAPAAQNAKIVGWSDPLDYSPVADLQIALGLTD